MGWTAPFGSYEVKGSSSTRDPSLWESPRLRLYLGNHSYPAVGIPFYPDSSRQDKAKPILWILSHTTTCSLDLHGQQWTSTISTRHWGHRTGRRPWCWKYTRYWSSKEKGGHCVEMGEISLTRCKANSSSWLGSYLTVDNCRDTESSAGRRYMQRKCWRNLRWDEERVGHTWSKIYEHESPGSTIELRWDEGSRRKYVKELRE